MKALVVQPEPDVEAGLLEYVMVQKGWDLDIRQMYLQGCHLPDKLTSYDAFVILGGHMGAYEEDSFPYLLQVQELVREAVRTHTPTVGICLGGQLIARALGAHVGPHRVRERGWYNIELTAAGVQSPLFSNLKPEIPVFQWHGDSFALPEGATLLAQGNSCINQAFNYEGCIWALQFHPEVNRKIIYQWIESQTHEAAAVGEVKELRVILQKTRAHWSRIYPMQIKFLENLESLLRTSYSRKMVV